VCGGASQARPFAIGIFDELGTHPSVLACPAPGADDGDVVLCFNESVGVSPTPPQLTATIGIGHTPIDLNRACLFPRIAHLPIF